ncbi:uncharacterized protein [Palaemon carinicauda]|uniref:uncharacterized protein n=1 Tax=Palaemon carinicauda TaxID=392227 RepID=UPI0035B5FC36
MYCDGSVNGVRVGCGVIVREYYEENVSVDEIMSKRIEDRTSTTAAELHAIHEGLKLVKNKRKDVFVFVDCQSALLALNSKSPVDIDLANGCKELVCAMERNGNFLNFFWVPSHAGIDLNEVADKLAKDATNKEDVDIESTVSLNRVKKGMRLKRCV